MQKAVSTEATGCIIQAVRDSKKEILARFAPCRCWRVGEVKLLSASEVLRSASLSGLGYLALAAAISLGKCLAQAPARPSGQPPAEIATRDIGLTIKTRVNLVSVPVVARDSQGRAIGGLVREDFQITDNGKPQIVSRFAVEKFGEAALETVEAGTAATPAAAAAPARPSMPDRFVAYFFDDVNIGYADFPRVREAVGRHMAALRANERAAIATASGQNSLDFTADRDRLRQALLAIRPQNKIMQNSADECPPMSIYQAEAYIKGDPFALDTAHADLVQCANQRYTYDEAAWKAKNHARVVLALADLNIRHVLSSLDALVGKMTRMAGQRTIVLISPGFRVLDERREETEVLEHAIRAGVVVNALDARGLYSDVVSDAEVRDVWRDCIREGCPTDPARGLTIQSTLTEKQRFAREEALANRDVLAEIAANTGGRFFENSNDLDAGLARLSNAPEYVYILGFVPGDLKLDGRYHTLKVSLRNQKGITLEARRGYYAPQYSDDPGERAKEEIQEAFFGRGETRDVPVVLQTQYFKTGSYEATVTVAAKVDLSPLVFQNAGGINRNDLTVVTGLFDQDGNYVRGTQKVVEMRLRDETLQALKRSGVTVRSEFDVTPGQYLVRVVVRDANSQLMAARSDSVEIP